MASVKVQWRMKADSKLLWPEWSHTTSESCCTGHVGTSIRAGVKGSHVVPQLILLLCFSQSLWQQSADCSLLLFAPASSSTWNRLPVGRKHSHIICHGLIKTVLEQGEALEHLQCVNTVSRGNTAEVFEKRKQIIQILLKAGFAIKQEYAKGTYRGKPAFRNQMSRWTLSGPNGCY